MSLGLEILLLSLFGSLGVLLRSFIEKFWATSEVNAIPWTTFLVNIVASFFAALALGWARHRGLSPDFSRILVVGFCGGLSTFSALSLQLFALLEVRNFSLAAFYFSMSVLVGVGAAWAGLLVSK